MLRNNRGVAETVLLLYVLGAVVLFFVPNKLSTALGVGNRQNRVVQTQKEEILRGPDGSLIKRTTSEDRDEQQSITFWEWLTSLPIFVLILMGLGVIFPPIAMVLGSLWNALKKDTRKIVVGVDNFLKENTDPVAKKNLLSELDKSQDTSTKKLVNKIQGKR